MTVKAAGKKCENRTVSRAREIPNRHSRYTSVTWPAIGGADVDAVPLSAAPGH